MKIPFSGYQNDGLRTAATPLWYNKDKDGRKKTGNAGDDRMKYSRMRRAGFLVRPNRLAARRRLARPEEAAP